MKIESLKNLSEASINFTYELYKSMTSKQKHTQQIAVEIKVIGGLLNYAFYEVINNEKMVTMNRWYNSTRSRTRAVIVI